MTIDFKAVQIHNPQIKNKENAKFYPKIYNTQKINLEKMCLDISQNTSLNSLTIRHVLIALEYQIEDYIESGHSIELPGIGIIYPSIKGNPSDTEKEVKADDIKKVNLNFRPTKRLKEAANRAKFKKIK